MSIGAVKCGVTDSRSTRRRKNKTRETNPASKIGHFPENFEPKEVRLDLPEPDETMGVGDILKGVLPDPEQDPVKEVNEIRRSI